MDISMVQMGAPQIGSAVPETGLPMVSKGSSQAPQARPLPQQPAPSMDETKFNPQQTDETRLENLQRAAEMMQTDIYVVADAKFSIYKDLSGQFVTRFTSLRDGAVTYFPEQDMNFYMESRGARRKALLQLDV